jgi:FkbM family methyltransferase
MPSRAKQKLAQLLSSRPVGIVVGTATRHRVRNRGIAFDTRGWDPRIEAMLTFRTYESAEIRFIRSFLKGSQCAVELGGSHGVAGSHLLHVMAPDGRLTSVEANAHLVPALRKTLYAHAGQRTVEVIHAAVTEDPTARFAVSQNALESRVAPGGVPVLGLSLQSIVLRAGFEDYALFSDIEGAEASFIFRAGALKGCTRMVIELHDTHHEGRRVTADDMVVELRARGFHLLDRYGNVCAMTH